MKKFKGISKEDFVDSYINGDLIIITYNEQYDEGNGSTYYFQTDLQVMNTKENINEIEEVFGVDLLKSRYVKAMSIVKVLRTSYTCPYCGAIITRKLKTEETKGAFSVQTPCCNNHIELEV